MRVENHRAYVFRQKYEFQIKCSVWYFNQAQNLIRYKDLDFDWDKNIAMTLMSVGVCGRTKIAETVPFYSYCSCKKLVICTFES